VGEFAGNLLLLLPLRESADCSPTWPVLLLVCGGERAFMKEWLVSGVGLNW